MGMPIAEIVISRCFYGFFVNEMAKEGSEKALKIGTEASRIITIETSNRSKAYCALTH